MGTNGVEGQRMSFGGQDEAVNISTKTDGNPKADDIRNETDEPTNDIKCHEEELDKDIVNYFKL